MDSVMSDNETIVRKFIAAWSRLDAEELASFFCDDGIYHNIPMGPVEGRENVENLIRGFIGSWTATDWEILNIASTGNLVFVERVDRTQAGDRSCDLPCNGVFELEGGKIKVWRDYFDMNTYQQGLG
jgi:limonene-1,2-epoxide hydrolase